MSGKRLVPLLLILLVVASGEVHAQNPSPPNQEPRTVLERLDDLGQNLFGGIFGNERNQRPQPEVLPEPTSYQPLPPRHGSVPPSAEAAWSQPSVNAVRQHPGGVSSPGEPAAPRSGTAPTVPPRQSAGSVPLGASSVINSQPAPGAGAGPGTQRHDPLANRPSAVPSGTSHRANAPPGFSAAEISGLPHPAQRPLHQRLSVLRDSAFEASRTAPIDPQADFEPNFDATPAAPKAEAPPATGRDGHLVIAQPGQGPVRQPAGTSPTPAIRQPAAERASADVAAPSTAGASAAVRRDGAAGAERYEAILFAQKGPVLDVETFGPRTISMGRESSYRVVIQNSGEVSADEVVVYIELPPSADVLGAEASSGATQLPAAGSGAFLWRVGQLQARSSERLTLRLVPRESRPFDLAVRWDYQPLAQQAMIEVQEPKLEMNLEGPREVHFGQREAYRLRLRNAGSGPAENVMITLLPVGAGSSQPVSHRVGVVEPGAEKLVEVELTARQTGNITVRVAIRADGDLAFELEEQILVRRSELQLVASGPSVRFVGSEVIYEVWVSNPGNAVARDVQLNATVPAGAKYLSGIEGGHLEADGTRVSWTVPLLEPGAEQRYQLRARLGLPGTNRLELVARAEDALTVSAEALTRVDAMADLAMEVNDPSAPVPVGSDAEYELRIRNRGTKAAENVEVIAYFSRGIEPVSAEGGTHRIGPGQVVFSPIPSLAAGSEIVLIVRARAEQPGNHIFRAEMHCKPLDTRLVREETTHFYQDGSSVAMDSKGEPISTADRRAAAGEAVQPEAPSQSAPETRR